LEPGVWDVSVTNPAPAGCGSLPEDDVALTIVPPPTVVDVMPEPTCSEQIEYEVHVTGSDFLVVSSDDGRLFPVVRIGDSDYSAHDATGCEPVDSLAYTLAERCTELILTVQAGDLAPGNHRVTVENPAPAGCVSTEPVELTVVPPPRLDAVAPLPVCTAQSNVDIVLTGEGFLTIGDQAPTAIVAAMEYPTVASECTSVEGPAAAVMTCTTLTVTIASGDFEEGGRFDVTVRNPDPAGCTTTDGGTLITVPPPVLTSVEPDYACLPTAPGGATLRGEGIIRVGEVLPTVTVGAVDAPVESLEECEELEGVPTVSVCRVARIALPQGLEVGVLDLVLTNPAPAGCVAEDAVVLHNLEPPAVVSAQPVLFCNTDGTVTITATGSNFYRVQGALPSLVIGETLFPADAVDGCIQVDGVDDEVDACDTIVATIPQDSITPNVYQVGVAGAAPLSCPSREPGPEIVVAGGPEIETYEPTVVCRGQFDGRITIRGTGFYVIDGVLPQVSTNGQVSEVVDTLDCVPVPTAPGVQSCGGMEILVPEVVRDEDLLVEMTNPPPADCAPSSIEVPLEEPPIIDDAQPRKICDAGGSLDLVGDHFVEGMVVALDEVLADTVVVHSAQSATATWAGGLEAGLATLVARNPSGCEATFEVQIRITEGPVVFFVDPPVLFSGISIQVTVFLGNLYGGSISQVLFTGEDDQVHELEFVFDPAEPGRVQAVVPTGLASGFYDVTLIDAVDCMGTTDDLVQVTDETRIALERITPPFGWTLDATGVSLEVLNPVPEGESPFVATPRAYLNPTDVMDGDAATELRALSFLGPFEVTGIVEAGLPVGQYDLIVVNPDATVGVLQAAFLVTAESPPVVDGVSPGSWQTNETALPIHIEGHGFRNSTLSAACIDSGGDPLPAPGFEVLQVEDAVIDATVDTTTLAHLSVCVLRFTNDDGTYAEFSPVTVTNPAGNFVAFRRGPDLEVARRQPAMIGAAPARTARFIYAFGGDDGTQEGTLQTSEFAVLNRFGEPGDWRPLPGQLPVGLSNTKAVRVGDFVYLAGGRTSQGATGSVYRSHVLGPLFVPRIVGVDFLFDSDGEIEFGDFGTGVHSYRVSAVMAQDDAANPGGETLASEAQPIFVPDLERGLQIVIEWTPIPGAVEYRVYRSAQPDLPAGSERLVATVPADTLFFVDGAMADVQEGQAPLPLGALGTWHEVAQLSQARFDHGLAVASDPADTAVWHVYAVGGTNGEVLIADLDILTVTVAGPRSQAVATAVVVDFLPEPRSGLEAVVADRTNASRLAPSTVVLYALSGQAARDITVVHRVVIGEGGVPGQIDTVQALRPFRSHYVAAVANNTIVALGGQGGVPSATGHSSEILEGGEVDNWNSLGNTGLLPRVRMGRAVFSGFLYVAGGTDADDAATRKVEFSILGGVP
jgi:hypothetical protein